MNQMKKLLALGALAMGMISQASYATVCENVNHVPTELTYDLGPIFTSTNNQIGSEVIAPGNSGLINVDAVCPPGTTETTTKRSYVSEMPVVETDGNWQYLKLNEYLLGAMSITDGYAGLFFPPVNYIQMGYHPGINTNQPFGLTDQNLVFRLKVIHRFINHVSLPRQTMLRVYVTTTDHDPLTTVVYTISYSGEITVPQTCEIDAGQIVEFDFGNIDAATFRDAGVGGKPTYATPQTKQIAIACTNVDAQAMLTLRLEAQRDSGDMMLSDNPDIGFKVANGSGTPLKPNSLADIIPFTLDNAATAVVPIMAWPVSVTGKRPDDGPFKAQGYLRVDYQ